MALSKKGSSEELSILSDVIINNYTTVYNLFMYDNWKDDIGRDVLKELSLLKPDEEALTKYLYILLRKNPSLIHAFDNVMDLLKEKNDEGD